MAMQYVAVHQGVGPIAVTQIAEQFNIPSELKRGGAQNLPDHVFLRMGVKGGGCSGYELDFEQRVAPARQAIRDSTASPSCATRKATST